MHRFQTRLFSFRTSAVKERLQLILVILFIFISLLLLLPDKLFANETAAPSLALEDRILRLHILAAGDDTASQEIKLHVRDAILTLVREPLAEATTAAEAEAALLPLLDAIAAAANEVLAEYGVSYRATAELTTEFFPIKQYGSLLLPPGEYRALRVLLGSAEGKNWWCMLYPSLCFTEGITATIAEEEKAELQGLLSEEEFHLLFSEETSKPVFCFRLQELWKQLKRFFSRNSAEVEGPLSYCRTEYSKKVLLANPSPVMYNYWYDNTTVHQSKGAFHEPSENHPYRICIC